MRTLSEILTRLDYINSCLCLYHLDHPGEDAPPCVLEWEAVIQVLYWVLNAPEDDTE